MGSRGLERTSCKTGSWMNDPEQVVIWNHQVQTKNKTVHNVHRHVCFTHGLITEPTVFIQRNRKLAEKWDRGRRGKGKPAAKPGKEYLLPRLPMR